MTRRQPYSHTIEPDPNASTEPDTKVWLNTISPEPEPLEVHLDDVDPATPEPPKKADPEPVAAQPEPEPAREEPKSSADDEAYRRLKAQLDRETQARESAQRRAQQLETDHQSTQERLREERERVHAYHRENLDAQAIAIDNALSFAESQAAQAQREINRGLSEGDYEASTNAYRSLAKAENDIARLKEGKSAVEAQKQAPVPRQDPVQQTTQQSPQTQWERIEAYITQPAHSLKAQQYFRDHYDDLFRDFDSGAKQLNKLLGGHYLAKADGAIDNSDGYFDYLDRHMGYKSDPEPPQPAPAPVAAAPAKKAVPPAAPVSRGNSNGGASSSSITLTPAQVAFCREAGVSPQDYARQLLKAKHGGTDPSYTGPRFTSDFQ